MAVAGDHYLRPLREQGVEGVQELFLRGRLFREEMQIVQHQQVAFAKLASKRGELALMHGGEEAIGELFRRSKRTAHLRMAIAHAGVNAFQQVRFSRTDWAVQDEGVKVLSRHVQQCLGAGRVVVAEFGFELGIVAPGIGRNEALGCDRLVAPGQANFFLGVVSQCNAAAQCHLLGGVAPYSGVLHIEEGKGQFGGRITQGSICHLD